MKKYIIMVAGYSYSGDGTDFSYIADKRRKYILSQNPTWENDTNVVFKRFDIKSGKIDSNASNGTSRSWTLESPSFDPINRRTHYKSNNFISAANNVMSIKNVYDYVINIGNTEPGSLKELSILGHGWMGGPVLVNSYERAEFQAGGASENDRDPLDKDGRIKDFLTNNMPSADWINFKKAFAGDGFAWVWGCVFTRAYFNTLYSLMKSEDFKKKRFGTHIDSDAFSISVSQNFASSYYGADPQFFPSSLSERTFSRTLGDVKKFLMRGMCNTYAGRFTLDTGIECRNAMLGTYSDYERSYPGHSVTHTVMIIPRNVANYGTDFTKTINFYKTYLGLVEDPEARGYGIYTATQMGTWWKSTSLTP